MGTYTRKWKIVELSLLVALAAVLLWGAASLHRQDALQEKLVRLHVIANSDSEDDQAMKLRARDAVLAQATALLEQSADRAEAMARLEESLPRLEKAAYDACAAPKQLVLVPDAGHGCSYLVDRPRVQAELAAFLSKYVSEEEPI